MDMGENKEWAGTTYGNGWMHKWLIRLLRYIDVRLLYIFVALFVIPVCLILNPSRKIIYQYFRKIHHYSIIKSCWKTYTNHCLFGQVVVDKFAMYAGKKFAIEIEGYEHFLELADKPEGFVQLSSHIGNYEIAGYSLKAEKKRFNALVFADEKQSVMQNREKMFADMNIRMIPVSRDLSHLFVLDSALSNGETVSMPADRVFGSSKTIEQSFLGLKAKFPQGPFSVATLRGYSVLTVNVMKTGLRSYKIYVTPLYYDNQASRKVQIEEVCTLYVAELERLIKLYPTQWYNFFNFWNE